MMSWNLAVLKRTRKFSFTNLIGPVIGSVAGAHLIIIFGVEVSFFEAILTPQYYKAMAGSFPIAFLLINYVGYTSERLDRHWSWINHFLHRALAQFIFGILLTGLAAFLLAFLYFRIRGLHILDILYLRVDIPVILLLIVLVNMFYVLVYFYGKLKVSHMPRIRHHQLCQCLRSIWKLLART